MGNVSLVPNSVPINAPTCKLSRGALIGGSAIAAGVALAGISTISLAVVPSMVLGMQTAILAGEIDLAIHSAAAASILSMNGAGGIVVGGIAIDLGIDQLIGGITCGKK